VQQMSGNSIMSSWGRAANAEAWFLERLSNEGILPFLFQENFSCGMQLNERRLDSTVFEQLSQPCVAWHTLAIPKSR
jgi:hypothetical protein